MLYNYAEKKIEHLGIFFYRNIVFVSIVCKKKKFNLEIRRVTTWGFLDGLIEKGIEKLLWS